MKIKVFLKYHAIERVDERVLKTGLDVKKILEILNSKLNEGILFPLRNEISKYWLGFPGLTFVFVLDKMNEHYNAITLKSVLQPPRKGQNVTISYFLNQ